MKLIVLGKPTATPNTAQTIIAEYDERRDLTTITCDVDIVTLGIAVAVLQEQFEQYLGEIKDSALANKIRKTTQEAVKQYEKY